QQPLSLDPAKVLQLVVQLAEATQQCDGLRQQSLERTDRITQLEQENAELRELLAEARLDQEKQATLLLDKVESYKAKAKSSRKALQELMDTTSKDFEVHRQLSDQLAAENSELRSTIQTSSKRFVSQLEEAEKTIISLQEQVDASREEAAEARAIAEQRRDVLFRERHQMQLELAQAEAKFTVEVTKLNKSFEQLQQQHNNANKETIVEQEEVVVISATKDSKATKKSSKKTKAEKEERRLDDDNNVKGARNNSHRRSSSSRRRRTSSSSKRRDRQRRSSRSSSSSSESSDSSTTSSSNSNSSATSTSTPSSRQSTPQKKARRRHNGDRNASSSKTKRETRRHRGDEGGTVSHLNVSDERTTPLHPSEGLTHQHRSDGGGADIRSAESSRLSARRDSSQRDPSRQQQQIQHSQQVASSHHMRNTRTTTSQQEMQTRTTLTNTKGVTAAAAAPFSSSVIPTYVQTLMNTAARQGTHSRRHHGCRDNLSLETTTTHGGGAHNVDPYALVEQYQRREERLSELDAQADALRRTRNDRVIQSVDLFLSRVDFLR
ncbi:Hypothetical protein, putative, partial [Bodo saltans]